MKTAAILLALLLPPAPARAAEAESWTLDGHL
jgi:hypothetical protein